METLDKKSIEGGLQLARPDGAPDSVKTVVTAVPYFGFGWRSVRNPNYHVYLFNISERTFSDVGNIRMVIPGLSVPDHTGKTVKKTLPGLSDKPYRLVTSFPQPMLFPKENFDTNEFDFVEQDVRRFIVALISPDLGAAGQVTLDRPVDPSLAFAQGKDLARSGVFFDYTPVPSKVELEKAYARMEKYYNTLLERARTLGLTDKTQFESQLRENPDYTFAAEYVGEEFDWHKKQRRAVECPNCGEKKVTTKPFHKTQDGFLCVDPTPEAWKQAYNVGLVQKDRVPEDFQWWAEPL